MSGSIHTYLLSFVGHDRICIKCMEFRELRVFGRSFFPMQSPSPSEFVVQQQQQKVLLQVCTYVWINLAHPFEMYY